MGFPRQKTEPMGSLDPPRDSSGSAAERPRGSSPRQHRPEGFRSVRPAALDTGAAAAPAAAAAAPRRAAALATPPPQEQAERPQQPAPGPALRRSGAPARIDPERFAAYELEQESEELRARVRPSPFLSPVQRQQPPEQPVPSGGGGGGGSDRRTAPSRAGASDELVAREEHRRVLAGLAAAHAEEIQRSDEVHARFCNDLVAALESVRSERDAQQAENAQMRRELEELEAEGGELQTLNERRQRTLGTSRSADGERRELVQQVAALREERDTLRFEAVRVRDAHLAQSAESRRAVSQMEVEISAVSAAVDELTTRLRGGTADYRQLDQSYAELSSQLRLGRRRLQQAEEELARREQARDLVRHQLAQCLELGEEAGRRAEAAATVPPVTVASVKRPPSVSSKKGPAAGDAVSVRNAQGGGVLPNQRHVPAEQCQQDLKHVGQALLRLSQLLQANRL